MNTVHRLAVNRDLDHVRLIELRTCRRLTRVLVEVQEPTADAGAADMRHLGKVGAAQDVPAVDELGGLARDRLPDGFVVLEVVVTTVEESNDCKSQNTYHENGDGQLDERGSTLGLHGGTEGTGGGHGEPPFTES